ncbi:hypothetical protein [Kitasatospora sp. NPDC096140]|uniref:hypothetical protein n=1 Tax=Kitasatospora sp. NPDC096140 TaxID=3155425 RepID=UPI003326DB3E
MRANHATEPREPASHGVAGARRGIARWLPRPRAVAAAGALLAQLWGLGVAGAYAASADPLPEPARPAVRRVPHSAPALDAPALDAPTLDAPTLDAAAPGAPAPDGQSAERPVGQGPSAGEAPRRSPGPPGGLADGSAGGAAGTSGGSLQDRIRAGGLPLPGQRAAVPDAFAIASGLLDTDPAQADPAEARAVRDGEPAAPPSAETHPGATRSTVPRQREGADTPPVLEASETDPVTGASTDRDATTAPAGPAAPGAGGTPETLAIADTATVTPVHHGSATATAVLAPIAAGLLLTGAAMCKHRGLPRGH